MNFINYQSCSSNSATINSSNFIVGSGCPQTTSGCNNSLYLDTTSCTLYKKCGDTWKKFRKSTKTQRQQPQPCVKYEPCVQPQPCVKYEPCVQPQPCVKYEPCVQPQPCVKFEPCVQPQPCVKFEPCVQPQPCVKFEPCVQPQPCVKYEPCIQPQPCVKYEQTQQPLQQCVRCIPSILPHSYQQCVPGPQGPQGPPGPANSGLIANVDILRMNVGTQNTVNVLANDIITLPLVSVAITAEPDLTSEGTAAFSGPFLNGNITFTPAPRFLTNGFFGYSITDTSSVTSSSVVKINVNKSYSIPSGFLYVNSGTLVNMLNIQFLTSTLVATLDQAATELASNRGDALLYYSNSFTGSSLITAHDYVTGNEFTLLDKSTLGFTLVAEAMGFDNKRYFLYVGFNNDGTTTPLIAKIAVDPYDRYNLPSVQGYTASLIDVTMAGVQVTGFVYDITVEESTGFLFATILVTGGTQVQLFKINPVTGEVIDSANTAPGVTKAHVSFSNNGLLYIFYNIEQELHQVNTSTLAIGPAIPLAISLTDTSELLFNM